MRRGARSSQARAHGRDRASAPILATNQECLSPGAGHDAIKQMHGIGDRTRRHVIVKREACPSSCSACVRDRARILALSDADLAEVLAFRAVSVHVVPRDQRKRRIGAAGAVRVDRVLSEAREVGQGLAERVRRGWCRRQRKRQTPHRRLAPRVPPAAARRCRSRRRARCGRASAAIGRNAGSVRSPCRDRR